MIEELKAYKQSVITEAVTKGLNPNAPMRNSGIDWIGEIPEHWEVIKLGRIFSFQGGFAFKSDGYVAESNNQVIRIGNVKNNLLLLDNSPVYIDDNLAEIASNYKLNENCILFTMTGTKGKRDYFFTLLLKKEHLVKNLFLNQRVGCFIAKENVCPNYYNYLLKDNGILDCIFFYETGTANQGNLGIDSISRTLLQMPPYDEQRKIASYLDTKCSEIDSLIALKQAKIEELKEYKKSVIYEYVTGKKEVV
jgi:type I restriction enzyme S subunit